VELDKLHVLVGEPGPRDHRGRVAGARVRRGGREVSLAVATAGQDGVLCLSKADGAFSIFFSPQSGSLDFVYFLFWL
jgi:hypothetical protein